jgi:hypothetical protein
VVVVGWSEDPFHEVAFDETFVVIPIVKLLWCGSFFPRGALTGSARRDNQRPRGTGLSTARQVPGEYATMSMHKDGEKYYRMIGKWPLIYTCPASQSGLGRMAYMIYAWTGSVYSPFGQIARVVPGDRVSSLGWSLTYFPDNAGTAVVARLALPRVKPAAACRRCGIEC